MLPLLIIMMPLAGTTLGALIVYFFKNELNMKLNKAMLSFAAGVMIAASIWSLLLPSIDLAHKQMVPSFFPATIGFLCGIAFLYFIEKYIDKNLNFDSKELKKENNDFFMLLAVTLHNIPEGMAVGVACAGALSKTSSVSMAAAFSLSFGISVQNFPEGAIVSVPLAGRFSKTKSFIIGILSGVVEPIAAVITVIFVSKVIILLPYLLSFAAGAMFYVTIEDLIPQGRNGSPQGFASMFFSIGFLIMMILDIVL